MLRRAVPKIHSPIETEIRAARNLRNEARQATKNSHAAKRLVAAEKKHLREIRAAQKLRAAEEQRQLLLLRMKQAQEASTDDGSSPTLSPSTTSPSSTDE